MRMTLTCDSQDITPRTKSTGLGDSMSLECRAPQKRVPQWTSPVLCWSIKLQKLWNCLCSKELLEAYRTWTYNMIFNSILLKFPFAWGMVESFLNRICFRSAQKNTTIPFQNLTLNSCYQEHHQIAFSNSKCHTALKNSKGKIWCCLIKSRPAGTSLSLLTWTCHIWKSQNNLDGSHDWSRRLW